MRIYKKEWIIKVILLLVIFIFLIQPISSQTEGPTHVISNSENWIDVFSTLHYANLQGLGSDFLVSTAHGTMILNNINKNNRILVVTSEDNPYIFNFPDMIRSKGYEVVDEIITDNANIDLARELDDINNFIVVGDSYGFNAVAVASYAVQTKSWIFIANRLNANDIENILDDREVDNLLIYGYVDREIRDALERFNPEIIDTGDKFKDNTEIVDKYLKIVPTKQVILTNGDFIENEIMKGGEPVLFSGKDNVPDQIRDYLKSSNIEIGVLIGNDLVGAATNIRRSAGISVMVKFARSARAQAGGVSPVEGLDLFPLPKPTIRISIHSIKYNRANSQLEITYKSDSNVPVYFKGTITVLVDGESFRVGDLDPIFIAPGNFKTVTYSLDITPSQNISAEVYTLFGETPASLDRVLQLKADIEVVEVIDQCKFDENNIKWIKYNKQKNAFIIKVVNPKESDCWLDLELSNIAIDRSIVTLGTEGAILIPAGKSKKIMIEEELTDEDLDNNPTIDIVVYSGEREDSLVNTFKATYPLKVESLTVLAYASIIILIIIILLIFFIILLKRREREEEGY